MRQTTPLAARIRPQTLDEYIGQSHLLSPDKNLYQMIANGQLHSMILWGPPGTGKTTLAHLLAHYAHAEVEAISAVLAGVKDIRAVIERAKQRLAVDPPQPTILFVDEVHRFNKSQQDAFLPFVENGLITLIGATTENPSFALNNALLSRTQVYVLTAFTADELRQIILRACRCLSAELAVELNCSDAACEQLIQMSDGDARQCLNLVELAAEQLATTAAQSPLIDEAVLLSIASDSRRRFDKQGDDFYDQISALHKSVRGSDPDAALYWLARMLDGGCDPLYICRRVLRMASEDIGNADPRALDIALQAWQTYERLGSPEGELAIAQAVVYLAVAAKSNAVYVAFNEAWRDAKRSGSLPVPKHLRNAPTQLMRDLGHGKEYRYAHDEANAFAAGERYFPTELSTQEYYQPVDRGLEIKIKEKLQRLRRLNE